MIVKHMYVIISLQIGIEVQNLYKVRLKVHPQSLLPLKVENDVFISATTYVDHSNIHTFTL